MRRRRELLAMSGRCRGRSLGSWQVGCTLHARSIPSSGMIRNSELPDDSVPHLFISRTFISSQYVDIHRRSLVYRCRQEGVTNLILVEWILHRIVDFGNQRICGTNLILIGWIYQWIMNYGNESFNLDDTKVLACKKFETRSRTTWLLLHSSLEKRSRIAYSFCQTVHSYLNL
jgi:hypothetical protein